MAFTTDAASRLSGPDWLRSRRTAAAERFASTALPSEQEEIWRYSRIDELDLGRYRPATGPGPASAGPGVLVEAVGERAALVVTSDGSLVSADVAPGVTGLTISDVSGLADGAEVLDADQTDADAFTELNAAFITGAVVVRTASGTVVRDPVVVAHQVSTDGVAAFPRTIVDAGEQSEVTVVELLVSADVNAFVAPVLQVRAGQAAHVRYVGVQGLGRRVWQTGYQISRVGRDASLVSANVVLGGDYARVRTDAKLTGVGGSSDLLAVYFGDGKQMHDFRTLQDHDAPRTRSDLLFKGAVAGDSTSVYTGLIRTRYGAKGSNAFQTNRNLVLSEGSHAYSVPNLEIFENDVRCSHASAVGPIDEEQRYYLEARGVPPAVADQLIVLGFFDEILERTPVAGLRPVLRQQVATKLESVAG